MHDVTHSSQPVPHFCLKCNQAATCALKRNFLRQQKLQWKITTTRRTRIHVVSPWALKPVPGNAAHKSPHPPSASTAKGCSCLSWWQFYRSEKSLIVATAGTRELQRLKPAFPISQKAHKRLLGFSQSISGFLSSLYQILFDIKGEKVTFCFDVTPSARAADCVTFWFYLQSQRNAGAPTWKPQHRAGYTTEQTCVRTNGAKNDALKATNRIPARRKIKTIQNAAWNMHEKRTDTRSIKVS